ncbi:MAG: STAS domain-containing protein [Bacteroidetes bacterium]|nr:STAS domain-containing protein [Bacteroidota bacterium]MCZ6694694.1 STAS domain-containing protein [Bacteroidota bacterium]MCZ6899980.1 STAS domain-containing protein [Bacteroidota bacterium]
MIDITKNLEEEFFVVKISGEVDASSSIYLDEAIKEPIQNNYKKIIVDCSELTYISSAGLGVFMSYIQEIKDQQIRLVIFGLNEKVNNVFQILGLHQLLPIAANKEDAKQLINGL